MPGRTTGADPQRNGNDLFPEMTLEEKSIWSDLYDNLREAMFPLKLPPLDLTSRPIPVVDRLAAKTSPWAVGTSAVVNGSILALAIVFALHAAAHHPQNLLSSHQIDLKDWEFPVLSKARASGGSGGSHDLIDPIQGRPPKLELTPLAPPQVAVIDAPKLAVDAAIAAPPDVSLPDNALPNLGVVKSPNVTLLSNGPGDRAGIGWHGAVGVGPGNGPGWGPGSDSGVYVPGRDGVTQPVPVFAPDPDFSDEARRQKYQGICVVALVVDAHGNPQNLHVVQHLGMGLDEKALEAIHRFRFKPAKKNGKPVAAAITVEVNFRLF